MLMRLMSKGEYLIVPKGIKFTGSGKLGLSIEKVAIENIFPHSRGSKTILEKNRFKTVHQNSHFGRDLIDGTDFRGLESDLSRKPNYVQGLVTAPSKNVFLIPVSQTLNTSPEKILF